MSIIPSHETVARLREEYPKGARVELVHMDDRFVKLKPGEHGTVEGVDDDGSILVDWDCGSGLSIIYGVDRIRKITDK